MAFVSPEHPPIFQLLDLTLPLFHTEADIQFQDFDSSPAISPQSSPKQSPSPIFASPFSSQARSPLPKRSWIWAHHARNKRSPHAVSQSRWNCAYCPKSFKSISGTGKPMRHLEVAHGLLRPGKRPETAQFSASTTPLTRLLESSSLSHGDWNIEIEQPPPQTHLFSSADFCGNYDRSRASSNDLDSWFGDLCPSSSSGFPAVDTAMLSPATTASTPDSVFEEDFPAPNASFSSPIVYLNQSSDSLSRSPSTKSALFAGLCPATRSWIWQHHENFPENDQRSICPHWRCAYCWKIYRRSSGTGKSMKHLREAHGIVC